jgi:hypothetical protein
MMATSQRVTLDESCFMPNRFLPLESVSCLCWRNRLPGRQSYISDRGTPARFEPFYSNADVERVPSAKEAEQTELPGREKGDSMSVKTIASPDPEVHSQNLQQLLRELIEHTRRDVMQVKEPRFQALLETTAEVLSGLETAFRHYSERKEPAWKP